MVNKNGEAPANLWSAAGAFVAGSPEDRAAGLGRLVAEGAQSYTPLHLHLFTSRLFEEDLSLRQAILEALGAVLDGQDSSNPIPYELRRYLLGLLARLGLAELRWILEALADTSRPPPAAVRLVSYIPQAGKHLARVAADTREDGKIRAAAARMIGEVGYVDALPALEGLEARLEGRRAGQLAMVFAPKDDPAADVILPVLKGALEILREVD